MDVGCWVSDIGCWMQHAGGHGCPIFNLQHPTSNFQYPMSRCGDAFTFDLVLYRAALQYRNIAISPSQNLHIGFYRPSVMEWNMQTRVVSEASSLQGSDPSNICKIRAPSRNTEAMDRIAFFRLDVCESFRHVSRRLTYASSLQFYRM